MAVSLQTLIDELEGFDIVDLSHRLESGMPTYPTHVQYFQMRWQPAGDPAVMNMLVLGEHTGTHVDAPSHFPADGRSPAIGEVPLMQLIGRCVTVRLGPFPEENVQVGRSAFEQWEDAHFPIAPGDILLLDFAWAGRWKRIPEGFAYCKGWPGLAKSAVDYLIDRSVRAVGTDCVSLDSGDGGHGELPAHYGLLPKGILILENLANLSTLPPVGLFVALPLNIHHGTGSPLRAVVLVPKGVQATAGCGTSR